MLTPSAVPPGQAAAPVRPSARPAHVSTILFPLPDRDFDVTEVSVPWRVLTRAGHIVRFATQDGSVAACDPRLLSGVLLGQLGADKEPKAFYAEMIASPEFLAPWSWNVGVDLDSVDAMWFAGGHARGMRQYLESLALQALARRFWETGRPVASICHGPLVLARAGLLAGRRTSCLPRYMELTAWSLTAWKLGDYYRTYPECVEDEVRRLGGVVETGPFTLIARGTNENDAPAWILEDQQYLSARWPGDSYLLAKRLAGRLAEGSPVSGASPSPTR